MAEKKTFVVSDKRKFTPEGELRPEAGGEEQPKQPAVTPPSAVRSESPSMSGGSSTAPLPVKQAQSTARDFGNRVERTAFRTPQDYEMNFERLVASLYMTGMMQLGLMHEEGQQPTADLLAAKQTIDTLGLLQEKTKGNLTDQEQHLLQNCLYELRMGFLELTNALARQAPPDVSTPGGKRE
jgi:hypothetical protein